MSSPDSDSEEGASRPPEPVAEWSTTLDSSGEQSVNQEAMNSLAPAATPAVNPIEAFATSLTPRRAVSYLRVSTQRQATRGDAIEGFSIPAQRDANKKKAQSMGAFIVKEFVDRGESARSVNRPELQRMLEYVRDNDVDFVIVHKVDRLARNREDDVDISRQLNSANVTLVSTTESIDQSPSGMLLHGIMSSIAEFYSRNLANEVVKGMTEKAKRGGTTGKAPLGYRNVGQFGTDGREMRTVVPDPERAEHITWAFKEYSTGQWSLAEIADKLTVRGVRTHQTPNVPSKPLNDGTLQKILTNPYYTGVVRFQGLTYPGRHEPLIDLETWELVQSVLTSRRFGERRKVHDHYLKSTIFCGSCGSRLIVQMTRSKTGELYPYFICAGRYARQSNGCEQRAVLIYTVEEGVEKLYDEIKKRITPEFRQKTELVLREELIDSKGDAERQLRQVRLEKDKLEREQERLLQAHYADAIPLDLFKREQDRIAVALRGIARQVGTLNDDHDDLQRTLALALDLLEQCPRAYRNAPDHIKKLFNQVFFEKVLVFRDESPKSQMAEPFAMLVGPQLRLSIEKASIDEDATPEIQNSPAQMSGTGEMAGFGTHFERQPRISAGSIFGNNTLVRVQGL